MGMTRKHVIALTKNDKERPNPPSPCSDALRTRRSGGAGITLCAGFALRTGRSRGPGRTGIAFGAGFAVRARVTLRARGAGGSL